MPLTSGVEVLTSSLKLRGRGNGDVTASPDGISPTMGETHSKKPKFTNFSSMDTNKSVSIDNGAGGAAMGTIVESGQFCKSCNRSPDWGG